MGSVITEQMDAPHQTIMMLTGQLLENCREDQQETLQAIQYGTRMVQLHVQDMTDLQKLKYDNFEVHNTTLKIDEAISNVVNINTVQAKQKNTTFQVEISPNTPPFVGTDSERVIQILQNVSVKAISLSKSHKVIMISCNAEPHGQQGRLHFAITVQGDPISLREQTKLFEIANSKGSQIGLFVAKQLCQMLGGNITLESNDSTTTFKFFVKFTY